MAANPGVIFAYHNAIYQPVSHYWQQVPTISEALIAHENVHLARQGKTEEGTQLWWHQYLTDVDFRYNEELLSHRAEYQHMILNAVNRNQRRGALHIVAKKLASPLYGRMKTEKQCQLDILENDDD